MSMHRRELLGGLGGLAAAAVLDRLGAPKRVGAAASARGSTGRAAAFPRKDDFIIEDGCTYLNAGFTHPIPRVALEAAREAAEARGTLRAPGTAGGAVLKEATRARFAALINASPTEIAYVPSTSAGENLVIQALELDRSFHGNVVSDSFHYHGALMHLMELRGRGLEVRIARPTAEFRIDFRDLERLVDRDTRLVEVTSTTMYNGFQHDLRRIADLAHAHGAYVYADIVHSAGAEPLDIRAAGVDFAACSSFKWLMGDFGLGFLYIREELIDRVRRPVVGYMQAAMLRDHVPPYDGVEAGDPVSYSFGRSAAALFEPGTLASNSSVATALLGASLAYVQELGVANIQAHRLPLLEKLRAEVPRLGFSPVTPPESTGGIITFARRDVGRSEVPARLRAAGIDVRVSQHWLRLTPSVYNDMADVERFLEALTAAVS